MKPIRNKQFAWIALLLILSLALPWAAFADNTVPDGDGATPVGENALNLINVCADSTTLSDVLVAIKRNGAYGSMNVYKTESTVIITVLSVSGAGLSAGVTSPGEITLTGWEDAENNTMSDPASSTVTFEAGGVGSFSGSVTYRATGIRDNNSVLTRDAIMLVTATIADCTPSDVTPPTASPTQEPPPNDNGWNNTDVTITWNWTDEVGGSGIDPNNCTMTTDATDEGQYEVSATCYDNAGNMGSATYAVKIDKTAPTVEVTGVTDGAIYTLGDVPTAGCSTTDGLSGVQTDATISVTGGPVVGSFTATCIGGTDYADNVAGDVSATYSVIYDWDGFFQPIDNFAFNSVKAGSAVQVKFSLDGYQGMSIFEAGYPKVWTISCDASAATNPVDTVTAGQSSLNYDADADQYVYVWKTQKAWAGTCGQLEVKLIDGTSHTANFRFR